MSAFRVVLLALLVVGTAVALLPTAATAGEIPEATGDETLDAATAQNGTANESSFGADISSFMQSNAAEVDGAVETGMWTAAYDATENRTVRVRLVERRTDDLRADLADLRERKQELADEREAGNLSEAAYRARVGQIVGQINALESAIGATETRARQVNASVENVTELRSRTDDLAGPEIAAVARNLSGVGAGEPGPPTDVGNGTGVGNGNGVGNGAGDGNRTGLGDGGNPGNGNGVGTGSDGGENGNGVGANDDGGNANGVGATDDRSDSDDDRTSTSDEDRTGGDDREVGNGDDAGGAGNTTTANPGQTPGDGRAARTTPSGATGEFAGSPSL